MKTATSISALEELVLRYREVSADAKARSLRISASPEILDRMIHESLMRGVTPLLGFDCVTFGPALDVYVDDSLPPDTFRIALRK